MNSRLPFQRELQILAEHAWDREVTWDEISRWAENFSGLHTLKDEEQRGALYLLTRFMFFSKRLTREMLRSLYRDLFESPLKQRARRSLRHSRDAVLIQRLYEGELKTTRFVAIGNPSESGAHLLYYFRQVNRLPKNLFVDCSSAFRPISPQGGIARYVPRDLAVTRYVFFDDLVGSGQQISSYLLPYIKGLRLAMPALDLHFLSLFSTTQGLKSLNSKAFFNGNAQCLFELDSSYAAFAANSRYFSNAPMWLDVAGLKQLCEFYGSRVEPDMPLGYRQGQLLLGFSHNTPDNTLPIFWNEGRKNPWSPIFLRYDKVYG
jgi:hypothetical protein